MDKKRLIGIIALALIIVPIVFNKVASLITAKIAAEMQKKPTQVEIAKTCFFSKKLLTKIEKCDIIHEK